MPNLDVRSLLYESELRLAGGVVVERQSRGATSDAYGNAARPPMVLVTFDPVVIHTSNGRDLQRLAEHDRVVEHITGYSEARTHTASVTYEPDVVRYADRRWRVDSVQDYGTQGGVFIWTAALIEDGAP